MKKNVFCCSIYAYITNVGTHHMDTRPITVLDVGFTSIAIVLNDPLRIPLALGAPRRLQTRFSILTVGGHILRKH